MRRSLSVMVLAAAAVLAFADEPKGDKGPAPREIKVAKGNFPPARTGFDKPKVIATAAELAKAVPDKETREAIAKDVDLKKESLLLFRWSGSGKDEVSFRTAKIEDGEEVVFAYTPGRTRDLRTHTRLYAIPKALTYRME